MKTTSQQEVSLLSNGRINNASLKQLNHKLYWSQKQRVAFVSFPRSGSNWACAMLSAMIRRAVLDGQTIKLTGRTGYSICPIDSPQTCYAEVLSKDYFSGIVKTHSHTWDNNTYVVYMFRDARETLASFRHWHRQHCPEREFNRWTDRRYVHTFLPKLLTDWWSAVRFGTRYPQNIRFIYYKHLLENPVPSMRRMADFLGLSLPERVLAEIAEKHSLVQMQAKSPSLIYREGKSNQGKGDFKKYLLALIALNSCVLYGMLRVLARRQPNPSAKSGIQRGA